MSETTERGNRAKRAGRRRRMRRLRYAAYIVLAAAASATACSALRMLAPRETEASRRENTLLQAERAAIEETVFASGQILSADEKTVTAKEDAQVEACYVQMGDEVKQGDLLLKLTNAQKEADLAQAEYELAIAQQAVADVKTHEMYRYEQAYDEDGEKRFDVETGEPILHKRSNEICIRAPGDGRVKAIAVHEGDDALAVYRKEGAVMVLSTDGRMKVELENTDGVKLSIGQTVRVVGRNIDTEGAVTELNRSGREVMVQIVGDTYPVGAEITVYTLQAETIGCGELAINKPLAVSAYGGTIRKLEVVENQMVCREDVLARLVWAEMPLYIENASVLLEYNKAMTVYEKAKEAVDALTITAPCDGVIRSIDVSDQGCTVSAEDALLTIAQDREPELILSVDELDIVDIQPGQTAILTADALADVSFEGTVTKIAPLGNTESAVTMYDVYVMLDEVDDRIRSGMNVTGKIITATAENAVVIANEALLKDQDGYYVIMEDGTSRRVEIGLMNDSRTQIIWGLSEGETVCSTEEIREN